MPFNSALFLFLFLPLLGLACLLAPRHRHNAILLAASALFYAWGEPTFILVVLFSAGLDYLIGLKLAAGSNPAQRKGWVALAVAANLGVLVYFKYANFFLENVGALLTWTGLKPPAWLPIALPIGVSFIVFEKITYVVDLYRGTGKPAASFSRYLLYVLFFPKLMAGPIIKYHEIADQLEKRVMGWEDLREGAMRFTFGLAKKCLLADTTGYFADKVFALPAGNLDPLTAWIGLLCFAVQIYFDFSGYSDMAIGLARCLGFRLRENFNQPYLALNFTDFWRRWHISLSSWIKEYLYIPLGGSRGTEARTYFNLWLCFLLSGLWHGASWMFVCWGAYHGFVLAVERRWWLDAQRRLPAGVNRGITFLLVVLGWIPFRAGTPGQAWEFFTALFHPRPAGVEISGEIWAFLFVSLAICLWPALRSPPSPGETGVRFPWARNLGLAGGFALFWVAVARLASSSYQSFIYFRF